MNRWREAAKIAWMNMGHNPVRSGLSLLGVTIGIAAVTAILALSAGVKEMVFDKFTSLGLSEYDVYPVYNHKTRRIGEFEQEDLARLNALPFIEAVLPETDLYGKTVRSSGGNAQANIFGMEQGALQGGFTLAAGRGFLSSETAGRAQVCLLSEPLLRDLFPAGDALGKTIWVEGTAWTTIGVFSATGYSKGGRSVLLPFSSLIRAYQGAKITSVSTLIKPGFTGDPTPRILAALDRGDINRQELFSVADKKKFLEEREKIVEIMTLVGTIIGMISLLVGGIGVMNVMLTSVAERTREIGLRRAMGARKLDILIQFLIESSVLSMLGGVLGFLLGVALAQIVPPLLPGALQHDLKVSIFPALLPLGIFSAGLLGVIFGLYPASQAARLSPAEALRTE